MAYVYLIRLASPLGSEKKQALYYLGSTVRLLERFYQHKQGTGARMLAAANDRGIPFWICKFVELPTVAEARALERKLKRRKNHKRLAVANWNQFLPKGGDDF